METKAQKNGPLQGIRVLDLADEKAAYCSKLLADLGARVIRIEKPGGNPSRQIGLYLKVSPCFQRSLSFEFNNMNKEGITLDLEDDEAREIFVKLIKTSDVVVETFTPGYLDELKLGFEDLNKVNPRLVLVSVTGFGQTGPLQKNKSCDLVASAVGGQMYTTGCPSSFPLKIFGWQSYFAASLFAAVGTLLALRRRRKTGKGEHIDISLQEAVIATLEHVMVRFFFENTITRRQGSLHWNRLFYISPCKDGFIQMTSFQNWETLVEWVDSEGMAEDLKDEKWRNEEFRYDHIDHVIKVISKWTRTHSRYELFHLGQLMGFAWAPVQSPKEVLECRHLKARKFFEDVELPGFDKSTKYPRFPAIFNPPLPSGSACTRKRAPLVGEDNKEIFGKQIKLSDYEMQRLSSKSVISKKYKMNDGPLSGIRVLDFSRVLAGPYATRIFGDFGAEVIKVQTKKTANGAESNTSVYFRAWNRNKRSITLDMDHSEARDLALRIACISDVVVENFSPRVMSNWGLGFERLKKDKPDIIMLSMSGMGQTGPWKDLVAFGATVQSLGGLTYLTSYDAKFPIGPGYAYADAMAGLYGAFAVLAALEFRDRTGEGVYIDLSEYEVVCSLIGPTLMEASATNGSRIFPAGNQAVDESAAPYGCYKCRGSDRWCTIAVFNETQWHALCKVLGGPEWSRMRKFSSLAKRKEHSEELDKFLESCTIKYHAEELVHLLNEAGVPAGVVQSAKDLATDPHLLHRNFFVRLEDPYFGETILDRSPIRFREDSPPRNWKPAPLFGEDNRYVFVELLGLSESEVSSYIKEGVIS
ncbi:MAG TPA: CoA transferase [Thermodesulforhabdus norvegica]|uniref:CoA transferase n=1 Tax=Thermodesulforhabdus norvegica TaxID=39841 RepID=A0A7C1B1H9_9BACT|nr:CoA transferase [Thermodesulforhabdus norvegica]